MVLCSLLDTRSSAWGMIVASSSFLFSPQLYGQQNLKAFLPLPFSEPLQKLPELKSAGFGVFLS